MTTASAIVSGRPEEVAIRSLSIMVMRCDLFLPFGGLGLRNDYPDVIVRSITKRFEFLFLVRFSEIKVLQKSEIEVADGMVMFLVLA